MERARVESLDGTVPHAAECANDADVPVLTDRSRINRLISPDHVLGQQLLAWRMRLGLLAWRPHGADEQALRSTIGRLAPAYTMLDLARLRQLARQAELVTRDRIRGAVVECGTWKGGSLALLDWVFRTRGDARTLWAFDSFEGLPEPGEKDPSAARRGFFPGWCAATEADVRAALAAVASSSELHVVRGWLDDTLPSSQTGAIAFLNVDVDWYESVKTVLQSLYDRVTPGGVINFDDYRRWRGCDEAVHEFLDQRELSRDILHAGSYGAWLRKPVERS